MADKTKDTLTIAVNSDTFTPPERSQTWIRRMGSDVARKMLEWGEITKEEFFQNFPSETI